jgi:hypothetical protein
VPEDDDDFQGLLEEEEVPALYPDVSAEFPGLTLEHEEGDFQAVVDELEPDFREMAAAVLHNAGIDGDEMMHRGRAQALAAAHAEQREVPLVDGDEDQLVYEVAVDLPDEGLVEVPLGDDRDDTSDLVITPEEDDEREHEVQQDAGGGQ